MATPRIDPSIVEIADIIRLVDANGTPLNLDWHTVNHSVNFVYPTTGANTQRIESEWHKNKRRLVRNSNKTTTSLMPSHLAWLWWRSINAPPNVKDPFLLLMEEIFNAFVALDDHLQSYMFEVSRNATKLHNCMAKLLAHPLQRPQQHIAHYKLKADESPS
ncbi:hypothetical protein HPB51_003173 [Rhipicephalus microplus]|uniref:Uncharacterized protein n=1 Tax=Rhipicephalus microplus TaxID=6941 RepID=A0A9J6EKM0_RHIMP|nr:hypothetical protein HPB51_003173 [Rhipicephalus microplus]